MRGSQTGDKPNIAYVAQTFPTLTQTFVYREVGQLRSLGFNIITCAIWRPNVANLSGESRHYVADSYYVFPIDWGRFILAHIQIFLKSPFQYLSTLLFVISRRGESLRNRQRSFIHFLEAVYLAPDLIEEQVEHIHAHFAINAATIALVLSRLLNISFSFTAHNIFYTDRVILQEKVIRARFIAAISDYSKQLLLQLNPVDGIDKKIHIVRCGLSPEEFSPAEIEITNEVPELLFVAQLEERKGAPYLVDACRLLTQEGIVYKCNIVGDGPQQVQLLDQISSYELEDSIKLLGALPQEKVKKHLASADIFILPCITADNGDVDGIPVSLMEAMAMEIPVISTQVSGIPELIEDRVSGLLVEEKDAAALCDAIKEMIQDLDLRRKIASQGRQKVVKEFNLFHTSAEIGDLFLQYLTDKNS